MQRLAVVILAFVCFTVAIAGCGGGTVTVPVPTVASIVITPNPVSLEQGKFVALTATALDSTGAALTGGSFTWSSSNTAIADVTTSTGAVCGGKWDSVTAPTVCTAGPEGTAEITATASGITAKIVVTVVRGVARVELSPPPDVCVSQAKTMQMAATAFDSSNNPIPGIAASSFTWSTTNAEIATIDANGLVTGKRPGSATVIASLATTNAVPVNILTCPPKLIALGTAGITPLETSFTVGNGVAKGIGATVTDIKGNPINDIHLTFSSSHPGVAALSNTTDRSATVTGGGAGIATVIASCTPPTCNPGVNETYYSNPLTVFVSGTSTPKVVVTGANANNVIIVDNGTPGTPIAIPQIDGALPFPTSLEISPDGATAYLGTNRGILRLDLASSTFGTSNNLDGNILAISPANARVLAGNTGRVVAYNVSSNFSGQAFLITNPGRSDFSIDTVKALVPSPSGTSVYDTIGNQLLSASPQAGSVLKFLPQSSAALISNGGTGTLIANCNYQTLASVGNVGTLLAKSNFAGRLWGADGSNLYELTVAGTYDAFSTASLIHCEPDVNVNPVARSLGTSVTPVQLITTPNGEFSYLISNSSTIYSARVGSSSVTPITLSGGATPLNGGSTPDGTSIYVSANDGALHKIDVATSTDVQQIPLALTKSDGSPASPTLVAVRPR
jgi:hypothetical protein